MNYAPGINSSSAYGAQASYGNALLMDGVDTRDPEGGSAWTFFNQNLIEEIQIGGLGAPAEYGGFTGAIINTVTKSGSNAFSGLFSMRYTNDTLASNNISEGRCSTQNPGLGEAAVTKKLTDYTVQMGGPIKRDKAFFFASIQRYSAHDRSDRTRRELAGHQPALQHEVHAAADVERHDRSGHAVRLVQRDRTRRVLAGGAGDRSPDGRRGRARMGVERAVAQGDSAPTPSSRRSSPATPATTTSIPSIRRRSPTTRTLDEYSGGGGGLYYADRSRNQVQASLTQVRRGVRQARVQVRRRDRAKPRAQPVPAVRSCRASTSSRTAACRTTGSVTATTSRGTTAHVRLRAGSVDAPAG